VAKVLILKIPVTAKLKIFDVCFQCFTGKFRKFPLTLMLSSNQGATFGAPKGNTKMATAAQIAANQRHDQATSALNGITLGLFTRRDFIRPKEESDYAKLQADLERELAPVGVLENTLVEEIRRATWRLRRCGEDEAGQLLRLNDNPTYIMDPMEAPDRNAHKIQNSVDRARSQAHRLLHKSTAELRKLQAERRQNPETQASPTEPAAQVLSGERAPLGSHCKTVKAPPIPGRNAQCPCGSGQKYKRCCARLTWEVPQPQAA